MSAVLKASDHDAPLPDPVRVVVVDDSAVVRGLLSRWLAEESDIQLVASLSNGREAVDWIARNEADVVVLDIDMPEMDGLAALPLLLARRRDLVVIMASTLTRRNAEISFKALSLGAADYVAKPEANRGITTTSFRRELTDKIRLVGHRRARFPRWRAAPRGGGGPHAAAGRGAPGGRGGKIGGPPQNHQTDYNKIKKKT
jgi:two-component system chemotaxis response regulator CheB